MNNTFLDIKNELFLSELSTFKGAVQNKIIYEIKPEYGSGTIVSHKIIDGMYLNYSEFEFKKTIKNNTNRDYCGEIIAIEYCLDGEWVCSFDTRVAFAGRGDSAHYSGKKCFEDLSYKARPYKSINIFCYYRDVADSLEKIFEIPKGKIENYYHNLYKMDDYLIIKPDDQVRSLLNELYKYIKCNNTELIKLRAIELFLWEINNYEHYINRKKKDYAKNLVEKIERVHHTIDENYSKNFTIKDLAESEKISPTSLKSCFRDMYGDTIYSYKKRCRMQKARELLLETDYRIYEIALIVGYHEVAMFTKAFKKTYHRTPTEYRKLKILSD